MKRYEVHNIILAPSPIKVDQAIEKKGGQIHKYDLKQFFIDQEDKSKKQAQIQFGFKYNHE
jgi:hypothetical protein